MASHNQEIGPSGLRQEDDRVTTRRTAHETPRQKSGRQNQQRRKRNSGGNSPFPETASNDGLHGQRPYDQPQHPAGHHTRRSRNNSDPDSHRRGPPQNRQYYPNPNSAYPGHCPPYYHGNQGGSPGYAPNQHHVSQHQGSSNCSRGGSNRSRSNSHNQNQHTPRANNYRQIFDDYWSIEDVSHALKRGQVIQGAVRINPKNFEDCYVPHPDGSSDVYISGLRDRNRALNTDIVTVQLNPRGDWKVLMDEVGMDGALMSQLEQLSVKPSTHDATADPESLVTKDGSANKATDKDHQSQTPSQSEDNTKKASSEAHQGDPKHVKNSQGAKTPQKSNNLRTAPKKRYTSLRDFLLSHQKPHKDDPTANQRDNDEELNSKMALVADNMLLRTGKVVAIIEKKHSRAATGHLKLMYDGNPSTALFAPLDHRMPRMMIAMADCPKDFYERPQDHSKVLYVARLTDWPSHSQMAHGNLARSLGEAGEIEPETEGILMDHGIDSSEFTSKVLDCLPQDLPWRIPASEYTYRKDLRDYCIFTIDPATARDLDDALHVKDLGNGNYEVGVHIADVSFFLHDDTDLDTVASDRATSVYMVQKVIPMLPRLLCEQLCSLNPAEDRLTFSVIWKMTQDGEIYDEWFGRSVIRSCVKLSYSHAQGFIEQPERDWTREELPPISGSFSVHDIMTGVLNLHKIAQNLRRKRFENGALRLDQVKLSFTLDKEMGMPNGYYVYEQKESNKLIEEFMLLANMAVAHKIYKTFPDVAVLRRHPPPQTRMVDDLRKTCESLGVPLDLSNSGSIHQSIEAITGNTPDDLARAQILTVLCSKPMQNAQYFCTGCLDDEAMYRHYALNVPLYTHFTSPIRRYPDVMVHRLLGAALGYREVPSKHKATLQSAAEHCNDKKTNSKRAQEMSSELFFAVFVKECGPIEERGMVMGVLDKAFDVLVLKLGVVKRVYCEKLPLREYRFRKDHRRPELTLIWNPTSEYPQEVRQSITLFSVVNCVLTAGDEALRWNAIIRHPEDCVVEDQEGE